MLTQTSEIAYGLGEFDLLLVTPEPLTQGGKEKYPYTHDNAV
jgi:hypothetical protein